MTPPQIGRATNFFLVHDGAPADMSIDTQTGHARALRKKSREITIMALGAGPLPNTAVATLRSRMQSRTHPETEIATGEASALHPDISSVWLPIWSSQDGCKTPSSATGSCEEPIGVCRAASLRRSRQNVGSKPCERVVVDAVRPRQTPAAPSGRDKLLQPLQAPTRLRAVLARRRRSRRISIAPGRFAQ